MKGSPFSRIARELVPLELLLSQVDFFSRSAYMYTRLMQFQNEQFCLIPEKDCPLD